VIEPAGPSVSPALGVQLAGRVVVVGPVMVVVVEVEVLVELLGEDGAGT
jgi:hypothetical protein